MRARSTAQAEKGALRAAKRLHELASNPEVEPEQRVLLHAILEADNAPAGELLAKSSSHALDELFASLRQRGERRALLYLVPQITST